MPTGTRYGGCFGCSFRAACFSEEEAGEFRLTPLSECLRSGTPGSIRDAVRMYGDMHWRAHGDLLFSVVTGKPAFGHVADAPVFEYLARHPDEGERVARGMANVSALENRTIALACDFSGASTVVDVGGGRGGFIAEVLKANPGLRGILYDEPHVVSEPSDLQNSGVAERCEVLGGDFFDSVPRGSDVYVLKRVLDGWDDERAVKLLRRCREAMPAHGRLLGIHAIAPRGAPYSPRDAAILMMDIVMLTGGGGRERTEEEFRHLYRQADFTLSRVIPTRSPLSILEGVPG